MQSFSDIFLTVLWQRMDNNSLYIRINLPEEFVFSEYEDFKLKLDDNEWESIRFDSQEIIYGFIDIDSNTSHTVCFDYKYEGEWHSLAPMSIYKWFSPSRDLGLGNAPSRPSLGPVTKGLLDKGDILVKPKVESIVVQENSDK